MINKDRVYRLTRKTNETNISIELNIDGKGSSSINTGLGFLDHMLDNFTKQSMFDLKINCTGDLKVDEHHSIEDIAIVLGLAIFNAMGDRKGIKRYGQSLLPMDEVLCLTALDFSRPYFSLDCNFVREKVGDFPTECLFDFLYSLSINAKMTLNIKVLSGRNEHHKIEAIFKSLGRAMREALEYDSRCKGYLSTKGVL